jgi:hypothetical protein
MIGLASWAQKYQISFEALNALQELMVALPVSEPSPVLG